MGLPGIANCEWADPDVMTPDRLCGIVGEAVAFNAIQRGMTTMLGGG